jgi:Glycosyl transferase family group 2
LSNCTRVIPNSLMSHAVLAKLGLVVIGRNEGDRLARCLRSVRAIPNRVYVDSGSTDGSVALARAEGVTVVELATPPHFTAARARNAGLAQLLTAHTEPDLAVVFGRRRERHPERSVYNALCDDEWNVPIGEASTCGGDALFRVDALRQVDFYNAAMIAGEDPELSMRLKKKGWRIRRIDVEMTLHDAAMTRFSQWWHRIRRSGHAYGEMAFLHPDVRDPNCPRSVLSILVWGGVMPAMMLLALLLALTINPAWWVAAGLLILALPLRMLQLAGRQQRRGLSAKVAMASGSLLILGKLPQFLGLMSYYFNRASGRASRLIEYKGHGTA